MKINFFIIGASALMLYAQSAPALTTIDPTDCEACGTDTGTCTKYGANCCDPCKCKFCVNGCKKYQDGESSCCIECSSSGGLTPGPSLGCNSTSCNTGEYYNPSSDGSTCCTSCPNSGTSKCSNTPCHPAITDCYIPSGTDFSDNTGSGKYTDDCHYVQFSKF